MITLFIIACLSLLDFQHTPKSDNPLSQFAVSDTFDNSATTGCTASPSQGRTANAMIEVEWINQHAAGPQTLLPHHSDNPLPMVADLDEQKTVFASLPKVMPYDPPGLPDPPEPETPPAVVPEPPTAAILAISGLALLYLLFGRKGQKGYR